MKFRWKVLLSNLILVAACFAVSGFLLIDHSWELSLSREVDSALEENQLIRTVLEMSVVNSIIRGEFEELSDLTLVGVSVEDTLEGLEGDFFLVDEEGRCYYSSADSESIHWELLAQMDGSKKNYVIYSAEGGWYIETVSLLEMGGSTVYTISVRDVSDIFADRDTLLQFYVVLAGSSIAVCGLVIFVLSLWLTMPIHSLKRTASVMASGQYHVRCSVHSEDEIGELGQTFNRMADAVELHVKELAEEAQRKEEFVANFTHEIKTPLTSIIGYADMIRSRELSQEVRALAANYIFNEGMRLETMSMKLFDLLLLSREELLAVPIRVTEWMEEIAESVRPMLESRGISLITQSETLYMKGDPDLLKTAVINLIDNARKASCEGDRILFTAQAEAGEIVLTIQDFGHGIPPEELHRITEAFYMVDKSRSRESGGAGLGLALSELILKKHGSGLEIESQVGQGTTMRLRLLLLSREELLASGHEESEWEESEPEEEELQ